MTSLHNNCESRVLVGDCRQVMKTMEAGSAHCCITSPPYWGLRDYGSDGQIGLEETPEEYVAKMVEVFRGVHRVLRNDGTLWLNIGDSYSHGGAGSRDPDRWPKQSRNDHMPTHAKKNSGLKPKDLVGIPWRVAFALQADGWYLRSDIIWHKPNPMPESVKDRPTSSHEHIFLMSKSEKYFYDNEAIKEPAKNWGTRDRSNWKARDKRHNTSKPHTGGEKGNFAETGRNKRNVWTVPSQPFSGAHFAVFPPKLIIPCVDAGCPAGGIVLDPFCGSGTTGVVARDRGRGFVGIEVNPEAAIMAEERILGATRQGRWF